MKTIDNDIKSGQLKRAYLLYGEETYLIRQYRNKLKNAFSSEGDTMNAAFFNGPDINPAQIIDLAETLPFFADYRFILIEDSGWAKKTPEEFGNYIENAPDTTAFVFVEKEIDKRSKLVKSVTKIGSVIEFPRQTDALLARWVGGRVAREGRKMTQKAYEQLILRTGNDMEAIDRELEKLLCYTMAQEIIDVADVEMIVTDHSERRIFDMVDSLANHKAKQAMEQYYELISQREAPLLILHLITRQFQNMMVVKSLANQGASVRDIGAAVGCADWLVRKYQNQCRPFSMERLKKAVEDGVKYETDVKTGQLQDHLAVELFISEYSK